MEGHYINKKDDCEDCNDNDSGYGSNDEIIDIPESQILKIKTIDEIYKLPNELIINIKKHLLPFLQSKRRIYNIIKSNLPKDEFTVYNFYDKKNYKIDWNKHKIGDLIIISPRAKWGWKERETYIRCYCPNCKDICSYKSTKLKENYFKSDYLCHDCNVNGLRPNENILFKICINCFECFKDPYYNDNIKLCEDCNNPDKLILNYCYISMRYSIYLSCLDCKNIFPKLCQKHKEKKILNKYEELFKSCKICIKWTPQKCRIHQYYFK